MPKDYSDQTPKISPHQDIAQNGNPSNAPLGIFPDKIQQARISNYKFYSDLFFGEHFQAFNQKVSSEDFNKAYSVLRYVSVNFAGMITKIAADMLFSEPITLTAGENGDQDYLDALWNENNMDVQVYEGALGNSYNGDDCWGIRIGPREPGDKKSSVIIEQFDPSIYFPDLDRFNARAMPSAHNKMWVFKHKNKDYLRKEIHTAGKIENKFYRMEADKIMEEVQQEAAGVSGIKVSEATNVPMPLIVHLPNWKTGNRYFGISDYFDLQSIFFAINNRITKSDNILDAHSDPILMVPPGVLDEKGRFKKKDHRVIEMGEGEDGKPEYVVWDASLENAFKEIEKLVEFIMMIGEVSPAIIGMDKNGAAESGRALKFKLLRTIAKVARKKMYYNIALRRVLYIAQTIGKAHGIEMGGKKIKGEPTYPTLTFADGLPADDKESLEVETMAIDAGMTSQREAIKRYYGVDDKEADRLIEEIKKEKAVAMPNMDITKDLLTKMDPDKKMAKQPPATNQ